MPKSSKKRKEKAADFSKAKLKLGKGKQLAANAIDTSFKARSIALPTQSITIDKDAAAHTTKKKQTFEDLVSHLKHYNAGTRKDAILGLRELLGNYPTLIPELLTSIISSCVRLMSDEEAIVRKTLLSFFQWLIPQIPADELTPHAPVILLFATSAQTHIFPEIRLDAIRFLDLFLDFMPQIVVDGWSEPGNTHGRRVLDGYFGLLNAGSKFGENNETGPIKATSTASVVLSAASKLVVLKSLSAFLRQAISSADSPSGSSSSVMPTWYMASSFSTPAAYVAFDCTLQASSSSAFTHKPWKLECTFYEETFVGRYPLVQDSNELAFSFQDLSDFSHATLDSKNSSAADRSNIAYISHLSHTLHSILVATFLDCAPAVFSPGSNPPETELQLVTALVEICRTLYNVILQGQATAETSRACDELKVILGYMSPYFPFHAGVTKRDVKIEQTVQELNLIFCELTSLLMLADWEPTQKSTKSKGRAVNKGKATQKGSVASLPIDRVSQYVAQLLEGESASFNGLSRPISLPAYTALLPTIWSLLNSSANLELANEVLVNAVDHAIRISSSSAVKRATVEFIGRLMLLRSETQYIGSFRTNGNRTVESKFEEWIIQLPKILWELGANHLGSTEAILRFLLRLFQRKGCKAEITESVCSRLIPYFTISHPTRGNLPGPFVKLPSTCRRLVLDLVATISLLPNVQMGDLSVAIEKALSVEEDRMYHSQTLK